MKKAHTIYRSQTQKLLEEDRKRRINSVDVKSYVILNEETGLDRMMAAGTDVASAYDSGKTSFASKKDLGNVQARALQKILEKALKALNLTRYIPVIGSIVSFFMVALGGASLILAAKKFTDQVLKISKVELSGVRSFLGEYSIFDASAADMEKVAEGLKKNMSPSDKKKLLNLYNVFSEELKNVLISALLSVKEISAGIGGYVALALDVTPSERVLRNVLMAATRFITDLESKNPKLIQNLFAISKTISSFGPNTIFPIIGLLSDPQRIQAFAKIDEIITSDQSAKDIAFDTLEYGAKKTGEIEASEARGIFDDTFSDIDLGLRASDFALQETKKIKLSKSQMRQIIKEELILAIRGSRR